MALGAFCTAAAHDLDDGFVERAVQARIRDGHLTVEYAFGLTENTMADVMTKSTAAVPAATAAAPEATASSTEPAVDSEERSLREKYKSFAAAEIKKQLELSVDGQRRPWNEVSIEDYAKHHYDFVVFLKFKLSDSGAIDLQIQDKNFVSLDGAARYALKSQREIDDFPDKRGSNHCPGQSPTTERP